jgi:hypothetical protein
MERPDLHADPAPLGRYFLARLERLLTLPTNAIAARGEAGVSLVLWALRSTFGDCRALGYAHEAALLLVTAPQVAAERPAEPHGE